ncbi:cytochrome P450 3A24-like isoform X2 [Mya arenaria]|uniref:cytochrome P450 3A24-like isoform X2 n=1 Tax=Mya arenaria TaxID=6604 RepID=UPI0022E456CF|nr:cytochrome P450 3A24-like isoform X2 [Mya arenaria]XP_052815530.1 cytochrome P450 3A24-like isoform X2 [Mya arenaria]
MEILGLFDLPRWVAAIIFFPLTVCLYTWYKQSYFKRLGIKQRKTTFFLGDIVDMAKKGLGYLNIEDYKKYGKVFGIYLGNRPTLVISDPDIIKQITVKQFDKFTNRAQMLNTPDFWKSALSTARGDTWRKIRHTLSPTFTSGKMRHMGPYLHKCLDVFHEILDTKCQENPEGFDIDPAVRGYTIDVICSTGFGTEVSAQTDPDNSFNRHAKIALTFRPATNPAFLLYVFFPDVIGAFPNLFPTNFLPKDTLNFFVDASKSFLEERKKGSSKHRDLLQLMVNAHNDEDVKTRTGNRIEGLTDNEILSNSIIFMLAGFDTTATSIAWVLYELALNPDVQEKLIDSIDQEIGDSELSYDNVFTMQYMDMVMSETLRIHPVVQRMNREASEDIEINGLKIKKGMDCTYCPPILHFNEEYWDEPNKFDPERFSPENKNRINEYAYIPFGLGPRNCIGMRLAQLEVKMTIISILQKYRIHKTEKLQVPMPSSKASGGINKPGEPLHLRLERRK